MGLGIGSSTSASSIRPSSLNSGAGPTAAQDPFSADVAKLMKDFQSLLGGGSASKTAPGTDAQGADSEESQNPMQGIMQALSKMVDALQQVVQQLGSLLGGKNQDTEGGDPLSLDGADDATATPPADDSAEA